MGGVAKVPQGHLVALYSAFGATFEFEASPISGVFVLMIYYHNFFPLPSPLPFSRIRLYPFQESLPLRPPFFG